MKKCNNVESKHCVLLCFSTLQSKPFAPSEDKPRKQVKVALPTRKQSNVYTVSLWQSWFSRKFYLEWDHLVPMIVRGPAGQTKDRLIVLPQGLTSCSIKCHHPVVEMWHLMHRRLQGPKRTSMHKKVPNTRHHRSETEGKPSIVYKALVYVITCFQWM